jgi:excisionase family DNA binding protein
MNTLTIEKSFCTTREAANLLGVSVGTVQLWVESGLLDAWKTAGGHRRVMRDSVERLLHKVPGQSLQAQSRPLPVTPTPLTPKATRRLNVLVVEDDANLLRLYQAKLAAWPMAAQVTTIDNAFAALLLMGRVSPDLLITDLDMPGMDGFEMLNVLSKAPETAQTTIVVVSGLDAPAIEAKGGLPPGVEALGKPIPFDRLHSIAVAIAAQKLLYQSPTNG